MGRGQKQKEPREGKKICHEGYAFSVFQRKLNKDTGVAKNGASKEI